MATLDDEEQDAYQRGLNLDESDLSLALVMADMRLAGTWPRGRPAATGTHADEIVARQRGLQRAWDERNP